MGMRVYDMGVHSVGMHVVGVVVHFVGVNGGGELGVDVQYTALKC
jgi:hypothetical protein